MDETPPAPEPVANQAVNLPPAAPLGEEAEASLYRFTVDQYLEAARLGIFPDGEKIELIEGIIVKMSPIGEAHNWGTSDLIAVFARLIIEKRAAVCSQSTIRLKRSAPEPDLILVRTESINRKSLPTAAEIALLVEASDSSIRKDRSYKLAMYAAECVVEYWIVNLQAKEIEVYREPNAAGRTYASKQTFKIGDSVAPLAFPDYFVAVADVFAAG